MRYFLTHRRDAGNQLKDQLDGMLELVTGPVQVLFDRYLVVSDRRLIGFETEHDPLRSCRFPRDVVLEPWIEHRPADPGADELDDPSSPGTEGAFIVRIIAEGEPLPWTAVLLIVADGSQTLAAMTGTDGMASFDWPASSVPDALIAAPYSDHWEMLVYKPWSGISVDCPVLPAASSTGWWHEAIDSRPGNAAEGSGIRIGVVDSGCGIHPHLQHVENVGWFSNLDHLTGEGAGVDSAKHGTHVAGIIASRPEGSGFSGIATGARVLSARALDAEDVANQGDLANAIEHLAIERKVDLINLSLSGPVASSILEDAILLARDHGVLCLCAAGNHGAEVRFPAALPTAVGIGAAGRSGWGIPGSSAAARVPANQKRVGRDGFYLANFSSFGPGLDALGPGVGIISTVPELAGLEAPYAVMCGTSMACPAVTASLAVVLASDAEYLDTERQPRRADRARRLLAESCFDLSLDSGYQGNGLMRIPRT